MKSFISLELIRTDGVLGFVVINDMDRPGHYAADLFPAVEINEKVFLVDRLHSNQIHVIKKKTRMIIYIKGEL